MGKSEDKSKGKSDNDDSDSTIVLSLLLQRQWRQPKAVYVLLIAYKTLAVYTELCSAYL